MKKLLTIFALLILFIAMPTAKISAEISGSGTNQVNILGDILVKKSSETNDKYNTTNTDAYEVKAGDTLDFTSTLYTGGIKDQLNNFSISFFGITRKIEDNVLIKDVVSTFTTIIEFPQSLDLSGVDAEAIKNQFNKDTSQVLRYDPENGKYAESYIAPLDLRQKKIDNNYHNDDVKAFYISDVKIEGQKITVVMSLNTETYYTEPNNTLGEKTTYAGYIKAAVNATPDYLALTVPNVKVKDSVKPGDEMQVGGKVIGKFTAIKPTRIGDLPVNLEWHSIQDIAVKHPNGDYSGKDSLAENDVDIVCTLTVPAPAKFLVTYDVNGGNKPISIDSVEVDPGEKAPFKQVEREGYDFVHWALGSEDGPKYDFEQPVVDNLLLVAKWQAKPSIPSNPEPKPEPKPVRKKVINTATK